MQACGLHISGLLRKWARRGFLVEPLPGACTRLHMRIAFDACARSGRTPVHSGFCCGGPPMVVERSATSRGPSERLDSKGLGVSLEKNQQKAASFSTVEEFACDAPKAAAELLSPA